MKVQINNRTIVLNAQTIAQLRADPRIIELRLTQEERELSPLESLMLEQIVCETARGE